MHYVARPNPCQSFFWNFSKQIDLGAMLGYVKHGSTRHAVPTEARALATTMPVMTPVARQLKTRPRKPERAHFQTEALKVLKTLQQALLEVIALIPTNIDRAADLERALRIRKTLAWQVHRMATAPDPLQEGANLPGRFAMDRFFNAASKVGVPKSKLTSASQAFAAFDKLVKTHAGDRNTFDAMVSGLAGDQNEPIDVATRRQALRLNSQIWGVLAKTHLACLIVQPSLKGLTIDAATVGGYVGLRRLRADATLVIACTRAYDDTGKALEVGAHEALTRQHQACPGLSLLEEFCTRPMPKIRSVRADSGFVDYELESDGVGTKSAITCMSCHVYRSCAERYVTDKNRHLMQTAVVRAPAEVLVNDILVHRDLGLPGEPRVLMYGNHRADGSMGPRRESDRLPVYASVRHLSRGIDALSTPDVPRYAEMAQYVFDRLGWDPAQFDAYRCRVGYPVMPSSVVVQFDLPTRPD